MSSHNADYVDGYKTALQDNFGTIGKIPTHNQKAFFQAIEFGVNFSDWVYAHPGVVLTNNSGNFNCPVGHNKEWYQGWQFGEVWEDDARDGM